MSLKVMGMQEMLDYFDNMAKVGEKCVENALSDAGDYVKDKEVAIAKDIHTDNGKGYSQNVGWKELKKYRVKTGKRGSKYICVGLRAKQSASKSKKDASSSSARPTHWDKIKGLWFNNYGFYNSRTGSYVTGTDWITKAYDDSIEGACDILRKEIEKGLDKL